MKNTPPVFLFLLLCLFSKVSFSQVAINSTGAAPDPSAVLDVSATNKGMLVPRVSLVSADNSSTPVNNPSVGLLVYNIDPVNLSTGFYMWTGAEWSALATMDQVQNIVHGPASAGIFGEMYEYHAIGTYSAISVSASGIYSAWNSALQGNFNGVDYSSSSLVILNPGTYNISFNSVVQLPLGGKIVDAALFVNGVRQDDMHGRAWFKEGNKSGSITFSGIAELPADATVKVYFTMDDNGTIRLEMANLNLTRLN